MKLRRFSLMLSALFLSAAGVAMGSGYSTQAGGGAGGSGTHHAAANNTGYGGGHNGSYPPNPDQDGADGAPGQSGDDAAANDTAVIFGPDHRTDEGGNGDAGDKGEGGAGGNDYVADITHLPIEGPTQLDTTNLQALGGAGAWGGDGTNGGDGGPYGGGGGGGGQAGHGGFAYCRTYGGSATAVAGHAGELAGRGGDGGYGWWSGGTGGDGGQAGEGGCATAYAQYAPGVATATQGNAGRSGLKGNGGDSDLDTPDSTPGGAGNPPADGTASPGGHGIQMDSAHPGGTTKDGSPGTTAPNYGSGGIRICR